MARATGVSRRAIAEAMRELSRRKTARKAPPTQARIRREGAGRKRTVDQDPGLLEDLDRLVDPVRVPDFEIREPDKGKVAPYGVYDLGRNVGWVSVGVDRDTAAFAVESIRRWWRWMGRPRYRKAKRLLITADSGGSNGARVRLWKWEWQQLADETGLEISVCHFPPGTPLPPPHPEQGGP